MAKASKQRGTRLGPRFKRLREKMGLSLEDLSRQTGLGAEALARIEDEEENPSVAAILQLSRALHADAGDLLSQAEKEVRGRDRRESLRKRRRSYAYTTLAPGSDALHLKAFQVTIEPGQDHEKVQYSHEGEEFIYVLEGTVEVSVGENRHRLKAGKSLHFLSTTPHTLRNPGTEPTRLLVVLYTP